MSKHIITGPAAAALLGNPAAATAYETQLQNDRIWGGKEYSKITCIAVNAGGESVAVSVLGSIEGLTPEIVAQRVGKLDFPRVCFEDLTIEVKGAEYNRITYTGTASRAILYIPPSAAPGTK
ncbi:MAG: hypothetical protein HDT15_01975 [Oscillibacter sp.]|nr:hypothetical protein [Oscillibacter sp.]